MKGILVLLLFLTLISCHVDDRKYTKSDFLVANSSAEEIGVYSSALIHRFDELVEIGFYDTISPGQVKSLRVISVSDSFDIEDVFIRLDIDQNGHKSDIQIMDKTKWEKGMKSDVVTFTLYVDSTFFKMPN